MFNKYIEKSVMQIDYTVLKSLACSEDSSIIRNYLNVIRLDHVKLKTSDQIHIFHSIIARHAKNDTTLDYILTNLREIKPRYKYIFYIFFHKYIICILIRIRYIYQSCLLFLQRNQNVCGNN